ncbi:MAG: chaperonin GroEL [Chloroflexi bacterium]|nr:chaperonin GroEL [Chloroflexota bacterium]
MAKKIIFGDAVRDALKKGVNTLGACVRVTLGPKGHPVALAKPWGAPLVIDDGVTIARDIDLPDPFENMGAQLVKEASSKTNDACGDGTTTSTVLACSIINEAFRNIAAGAEPIAVKRGVETATNVLVAALRKASQPVSGREQIVQVATITAKDPEIGDLIADVMEKVGKDGVITIEESRGIKYYVDYVEGMQFDRGYLSPYFVTDTARMESVMEDPYILMTDRKIETVAELVPALEKITQISKNIVIICENIEPEAMATLIVNKLRGGLNVLAVKAPGFGDRQKAMLADMAVLTGGRVISKDTGRKLDSLTEEDLGRARKIVSNKDKTTIIEGKGSIEEIQDRIQQIQVQIGETDSAFDREKLQERQAALAGGVAVIAVGGATETEMKERKARVEDALSATRAAVEEGILPGGGVGLLNAMAALKDLRLSDDEEAGVAVVKKALTEPVYWIARNAGKDGSVIVAKVLECQEGFGYNAATDEFGDMVAMGIIDPTMVVRASLENAASIAGMVLVTESLVAEVKNNYTDLTQPNDGSM